MSVAVTTLEGLRNLRNRLRAERDAGRDVGYDCEYDCPTVEHRGKKRIDPLRADVIGYSVAVLGEAEGRYVPFTFPGSESLEPGFVDEAKRLLRDLMTDPRPRVWGHNWKGELHALRRLGIEPRCVTLDSEIMCWLAGWRLPGKGGLKLKAQMAARFGQRRPGFEDVANGRLPSTVPLAELAPYAAQDAVDTLVLGRAAMERCKDLDLGAQWALDRSCIPVTAAMEATGVPLDTEALLAHASRCEAEMATVEARFAELTRTTVLLPTKVKEQARCPVCEDGLELGPCTIPGCVSGFLFFKNGKPKLRTVERLKPTEASAHPGNDRQVGRWLFDELKLWPKAGHPQTKDGHWSTEAESIQPYTALPGMAGELAVLRLRFQALRKYATTYTRGLVHLAAQSGDGRLHSTFRQDGTDTSRYSSSGPNQQNLPGSDRLPHPWLADLPDIRATFQAAPGWRVVVRDFSQVELRVTAHYSRDARLLEAYRTGADLHSLTMERLGIPRRNAKVANFSTIYRISAKSLRIKTALATNDWSRTVAQVQDDIDAWYDLYPGVADMHQRLIEEAERNRYASTLTGFKRPLTEWSGRRRWGTENQAINTPIQGTAGGLIKRAQVALHTLWGERGWLGDPARGFAGAKVRWVAQVHDELIVEAMDSVAEQVNDDMDRAMVAAGPELVVPLASSGGIGNSWADAKAGH